MRTAAFARYLFPVAALLAALPLLASAQSATSAAKPPRPDEVVRRMAAELAGAKSFSFHAEINFDDVLPSGVKLQYAGGMSVLAQRPNQLHIDYRDDLSTKALWNDGRTVTLVDLGEGIHASTPAAADLDATIDTLATAAGITLPLSDLLAADPYKTLMQGVKRKRWIGVNDVDGTPCDHLAFIDDQVDWQLWVERGNRPVPRKVVITYKNQPSSPQYVANLMDWDFSPKITKTSFEAVIPKDAKAAEFLMVAEMER